MTWTFPLSAPPPAQLETESLRALVATACGGLAARVRDGAVPVAVAPAPTEPAPGWAHWHPWPELFIQLCGASRFSTPGGDLGLRAGTALLFPPLSAHTEFSDATQGPFANLVFTLRPGGVNYHLALQAPNGPHPRVVRPDYLEGGDGLGQALLHALSRAGGDDDLRCGGLLAFCAWTRALISGSAAAADAPQGSPRVRQVTSLIHNRLGSPTLSVQDLAEWVGCHPDHLARIFRAETGETLVGCILRVRLERAHDLLRDPRLKVRDVARLVGFADPAYFCRVYHRRFGCPPSLGRG